MNVSNVNQIFNEKLQNINSRLPETTSVNNKFQSILEQVNFKNNTSNEVETSKISNESVSNDVDINSLLKTMLSTQSTLGSLSSSNDTSSSLFPTSTMNNAINMIQQNQLLNALSKKNSETK